MNAKYIHTNLIARDWRALAAFYENVFGCVPVPPERDYHGDALDALTALKGERLRGVHLRLPGCGEAGPTLEIFGYNEVLPKPTPAVNRLGYGHLAFFVDDVMQAQTTVLAAGGQRIGEIVVLTTATGTRLNVCYVTDPEGNIIELLSVLTS
ncbi:MAG: VOC family protein [Anaerolineae bacterium]|nr:VOC family protein [Anaerolineae bacterium]